MPRSSFRSCEKNLRGCRPWNQDRKAELQRSFIEPPKAKLADENIVPILILSFFTASFAWAGVFSCHRNFRHWQPILSHALGTKTLSAIRAVALLDLQLLSTSAKLRDSAFPWMLRIVAGTRAPVCGLCVYGYVVMPEHVHLLVNEPERGCLAQMPQSLK